MSWEEAIGECLAHWEERPHLVRGDGAQAAELARLKGEMDAIEQVSTRKQCGIEFQRAPQPVATPVAERG